MLWSWRDSARFVACGARLGAFSTASQPPSGRGARGNTGLMRSVTYAGQTVHTTDEIADVLVLLTAAVAKQGNAEAISIPILDSRTGETGTAELVIEVIRSPVTVIIALATTFPVVTSSIRAARTTVTESRKDWAPDGAANTAPQAANVAAVLIKRMYDPC